MANHLPGAVSMAECLLDGYDGVLFDLDGVIYVGALPVPGAVATLAELRRRGIPVGFVTNNAARTPEDISAHLGRLGVKCVPGEVIVSSQALAHLMKRQLPPGTRVLVAGPPSLAQRMTKTGFVVVSRADEGPDAVVQGWHPDLPWSLMNEAALALGAGAAWYATNTDALRPVEAGLIPAAGSQVAALQFCFPDRTPIVAGKPFPPLFQEMTSRLGAQHALFVGDLLDTDIAGANRAGLDSLFVLSGTHGKADLVSAEPALRPTHLGLDIAALLAPVRGAADRPAPVRQTPRHGIELTGPLDTAEEQADALWDLANFAWHQADQGTPLDVDAALDQLTLVE